MNQFNFKAKGEKRADLSDTLRTEVLQRTACEISEKEITARFAVGFPANGRTINAKELEKILFEYLPQCVEQSFYYKNLNAQKVKEVVELAKISRQSVRSCQNLGWLRLWRMTPCCCKGERYLFQANEAVCKIYFSETMRVTLELPHRGKITGMGVPKGITLIVGGGFIMENLRF